MASFKVIIPLSNFEVQTFSLIMVEDYIQCQLVKANLNEQIYREILGKLADQSQFFTIKMTSLERQPQVLRTDGPPP